jgi:uncharacterized protein GlcG (DUF336 family)
LTSSAYVSQVYQDLLGRPADTTGGGRWSALVDRGIPRSQIALNVLNSPEYQTNVVQGLFQNLLGRPADPDGLSTYVGFLSRGDSLQQIEADILGSNEYFTTRGGGTNVGFLQAIYPDALGRPLDDAGGQVWGNALASGTDRSTVAADILNSSEGQQNAVNAIFQQFLGRSADPAGLSTFTQLLAHGASYQQIMADVIGSDEFSGLADPPADPGGVPPDPNVTLQPAQVTQLLQRAAAAANVNNAIIAIVDRPGHILGVRVESGVAANIQNNPQLLTFAIDGALAEARTAAFFANNQAPLTSRTIETLSQTTITQQEVQSNPNIEDPNSPLRGPGFVAPIGTGGHFPPNIQDTPPVDLFGIEHTNRDSILHVGPSQIKGVDDINMADLGHERFNINLAFVPPGQQLTPPESYGFVSGIFTQAQGRGIGTLPGGIPIYENGVLVGGLGVFFPGTTGFATEENSALSADYNPSKPDLSLEAEWMAFAAVGGSPGAGFPVGTLNGIAPLAGFALPFGRIDLAGITLPLFGPDGLQGPAYLAAVGATLGVGNPNSGVNEPLFPGDTTHAPTDPAGGMPGQVAPDGWLVTPHDGVNFTAAQVNQIITQGINAATLVRAQIRTPIGVRAKFVFAVVDETGEVLGMYRQPDATIFSEDVAVAKARNVAYYDNAAMLQPIDQVNGLPPGVAMTARTFRFLGQPRYPEGIDGTHPGPFSILNDGGANPLTALSNGPPLPASAYVSVLGHDAFNPQTNFRQPFSLNQNGIVFFPGSSAVYQTINGTPTMIGGWGVSGDGVTEDDVTTTQGIVGFQPPANITADNFFVAGARLPYAVFSRNPLA